jgi:hypothetical protein
MIPKREGVSMKNFRKAIVATIVAVVMALRRTAYAHTNFIRVLTPLPPIPAPYPYYSYLTYPSYRPYYAPGYYYPRHYYPRRHYRPYYYPRPYIEPYGHYYYRY